MFVSLPDPSAFAPVRFATRARWRRGRSARWRTRLGALALLALSFSTNAATLAGRVVADPRSNLRIGTEQAGRLEAPPGGFPSPGQRLQAGQVLAYLRPSIPAPERRDLDAQLAAADRDVTLGELQVKRFNAVEVDQFDGQVALPSLQILGDYKSARARREQLSVALDGRLPLVAARSGTLLASRARSDRNLSAGETVFEIGDAGGLAVEALTPDVQLDAAGLQEAVTPDGATLPLELIAESFDPDLRARRFLFAVAGAPSLRVGEPVRIRSGDAAR